MLDMIAKIDIISTCNRLLDDRATRLQQAIDDTREAALGETKSSAGDKYETGREMMLAEIERLGQQVDEVARLREGLFAVEGAMPGTEVTLGSLVKTNRATYFLAVGLGKVTVSGVEVFVLSTASPIGQLLLGKTVGEQILFKGEEQTVLSVT